MNHTVTSQMVNANNNNNKARAFPVCILSTPGGSDMAEVIDKYLIEIFENNNDPAPKTFIRECENYRFQNGEGKGVIVDSIRGTDLYIIVDVGNYGETYKRQGQNVQMGPDEHYMDLRRLLGAAKNMAQRTTVIMPLLYESRQHKMKQRESLDCALALQEMVHAGVDTVMTIDAHNSHVMNAIPMHGLENLHASYQLIEAFLEETRGKLNIVPDELMICSPDLGGLERARYFANHFRVHLSGFYKVRDLTRVVNGKNPVIEHKFLGESMDGKNAIVVDDMLASGGSMLEVCDELKKQGAKEIYLMATFALFSNGLEKFDEAYKAGKFTKLFGTNATYVPDELKNRDWFVEVDVTKFIAKFIHTFNHDGSVTQLLDSTERISEMLASEFPNRDWD